MKLATKIILGLLILIAFPSMFADSYTDINQFYRPSMANITWYSPEPFSYTSIEVTPYCVIITGGLYEGYYCNPSNVSIIEPFEITPYSIFICPTDTESIMMFFVLIGILISSALISLMYMRIPIITIICGLCIIIFSFTVMNCHKFVGFSCIAIGLSFLFTSSIK